MGGGYALALAPGRGFSASSVNYGGCPADAGEWLPEACPIVGSFGGARSTWSRAAAEQYRSGGRHEPGGGADDPVGGVPGTFARDSHRVCSGFPVVRGWVSYMRMATTSPEIAVIAATTQTAARTPHRSATIPETTAPTANPPSRQSR